MAIRHGTRGRYNDGCRCDECKWANTSYRREKRARDAAGGGTARVVPFTQAVPTAAAEPGRVESAVERELDGLAQAEARPGLKEAAVALARILDNPKAVSQQPAAAKNLAEILERLRKGADARKSRLTSVRQMTRSSTG